MLILRFAVWIFSVGMVAVSAGVASGQDYPNKPIRIVTAAAGGGAADFTTRVIAQGISGPLGQPVVVDNRAGGGFIVGEVVSKAPPDGYTLNISGASIWTSPLLRKAPYDFVRDFSPISLLVREIYIVAVHPSVPAKSIKELIALAKSKPGVLNYSSGALGGSGHLAAESFKAMAGVDIVGVTYKGAAPAVTALISGEVQMMISDANTIMPHAKSGKLRALAVASAEPSALTPGLPTVGASGLQGYEMVGRTGIFAPAKTPVPIINRLNQEIVRVLNRPDVKEQFLKNGAESVGNSPEQFAAEIKSEIARWSKVIKDAGIKTD